MGKDSYVVCRVFLKSEIGPPHKDRYAPFIEEEWDDDKTGSSQGGKSVDEAIVDSKACIEESDLEQDAQSTTLRQSEHLKNSGSVLSLSPSERLEDCPLTCTVNKESTIFPNKRSRHDDLNPQHSDASESSLMTIQECTITKKSSPPSIFGFPLVELNGKKECQIKKELPTAPSGTFVELNGKKESQIKKEISTAPHSATVVELNGMKESEIKNEVSRTPPATFDISDGNATLPPSYLKYITYLEDKVREMSAERERLKADMMQAESIVNAYKSRIDITLNNGNED